MKKYLYDSNKTNKISKISQIFILKFLNLFNLSVEIFKNEIAIKGRIILNVLINITLFFWEKNSSISSSNLNA